MSSCAHSNIFIRAEGALQKGSIKTYFFGSSFWAVVWMERRVNCVRLGSLLRCALVDKWQKVAPTRLSSMKVFLPKFTIKVTTLVNPIIFSGLQPVAESRLYITIQLLLFYFKWRQTTRAKLNCMAFFRRQSKQGFVYTP